MTYEAQSSETPDISIDKKNKKFNKKRTQRQMPPGLFMHSLPELCKQVQGIFIKK